ncbi:MAG: RNA polymerase sigma factor [Sphingobacteriales bacterium]|jgi:RNA polymerase sigma factor (sigma-70 family)|nr:RNA polymerase sigma factor [Sphingobacteriales bacterium]MBP9140827.1 RNA polymerase sigma factor [Chitinophagales bacterium]MDA0198367.1 RNA polymerase sigma factor [Bacteroidota bacterium]MBK6891191.1 RNA polymerase sigma factor [Sphingobacteriales bacterium]MBK7526984.1 RNA polymerase sigma factor [Sphingobacteriales bacterium]
MDIALPLQSSNLTDELLAGCVRQDRLYQKRLYELFYGKMIALCLRYSNDYEEARDILHEGFMKVYKNIAQYQPRHSLESWIRRIMINTAIDHYRRNRKFQKDLDLEQAQHHVEPINNHILGKLTADEIMLLVQKLTPAYRTVFNLYVIEGFNHAEIAKKLSISEGTSKSNLAKARAKLQVMIREAYPGFFR